MPEAFIPIAIWAAISPGTVLTPLPWLLATILVAGGAALNLTNASFYLNKSPLCPTQPFLETGLHITFVLISFVIGTVIFFYAKLSWLYMLILIALTIWALITARLFGEQKSPETAKRAYMAWAAQVAIYILSLVLFYSIK
jgi:small-conductance mechanosensitive channel